MFITSLEVTLCLLLSSDLVFGQQQLYPITRGPAGSDVPDPGSIIGVDNIFKVNITRDHFLRLGKANLNRRGDAYFFNAFKYILNLFIFRQKQNGLWTPPPILPLQPKPLDRLSSLCFIPNTYKTDILDDYMHGYVKDLDLRNGSNYLSFYGHGSCTKHGYMPLLKCKPDTRYPPAMYPTIWPAEPIQLGFCVCSVEDRISRWTPFVYKEIENATGHVTRCDGMVGAHCDNTHVFCSDGLECDNGTCAGNLGQLARGYGGAITFSDEELNQAIRETNLESLDEITSYLIRTSNSRGALGRDCDPKYWEWATLSLLPYLKTFNKTDPNFDLGMSDHDFWRVVTEASLIQLSQYQVASTYKGADWLRDVDDVNLNYVAKMAEYYDNGESCLNEFPRMACVRKTNDPQRGLCQCSNQAQFNSSIFIYKKQGTQCVGGVGAVCTTLRGSGDHNCAKGLVCSSVLKDEDDPKASGVGRKGALNHYAIKVCKKPKGNVGDKDKDKKTTTKPTNHGVTTNVSLTFLILTSVTVSWILPLLV